MKVKYLLFDMDGVLVDSMKYHIEAWKKAFAKFDIKLKKEDLTGLGGVNIDDTINIISNKYGKKLSHEEMYTLYAIKFHTFKEIAKIEPYEKINIELKKLKKQNFKLALVTGSTKEHTTEVINKYFKNIFDVIVTSSDYKNGKPNKDPYLTAIKKLNAKPSEAIVIEDSPMGIKSANSANIKSIGITTTVTKDRLFGADYIVKNHDELFNLLKKFNI